MRTKILVRLLCVLGALCIAGLYRAHTLEHIYLSRLSTTLIDAGERVTVIEKNAAEEFAGAGLLDPETARILLDQEDQQYYYHLGVNPIRIITAAYNSYRYNTAGSGSTVPQQLAKILSGNETSRTMLHKISELADAVVLSVFFSKTTVLTMYANSLYMGNSVRGLPTASLTYYSKPLAELSTQEKKSLVETIPAPTTRNPASRHLTKVSRPYSIALYPELSPQLSGCKEKIVQTSYSVALNGCRITIDKKLEGTVREMLQSKVEQLGYAGVTSGAVIILDTHDNSVLAAVGTPYPTSTTSGSNIDMTRASRPIGSIIKPLIYVEAFKKGLRPYSHIEDREYSFTTENGSKIYPKNYDGKYYGYVTSHYALSNSLNVPAVKALEFVGLPRMYALLQGELGVAPASPLESYGYGIALGGLETTPLKLAEILSIFPREGLYSPLKFFRDEHPKSTRIEPVEETRLVTSILSDKFSRADQFGITTLTLPFDNYAVKTGTSRDYHDSWTVGYTPDILVLTWLGNPENKPLRAITGGIGAGSLWKDIMLLVHNEHTVQTCVHRSELCSEHTFSKDGIAPHPRDTIASYTLARDTTLAPDIRDTSLILFPHNGDIFAVGSTIPIQARVPTNVKVNNVPVADPLQFSPIMAGTYTVSATRADGTSETVTITVK
jgi:penicillin-binding protein 1C